MIPLSNPGLSRFTYEGAEGARMMEQPLRVNPLCNAGPERVPSAVNRQASVVPNVPSV